MSFIHNELLPRLEANAITREEMQTYFEDLKNLREKFFGKIKVKLEVLAFFSYSNSFGEAFNFLAKVSLEEKPENYFYINASKTFDIDGWEVWEIKSKFANDYKHTQHDLENVVNPVNWYYFSFINARFESNKSLAGEYYDIEVPEAMTDYHHQIQTGELKLSLLEDVSEDVVITSHMTQKDYNDVISFYI